MRLLWARMTPETWDFGEPSKWSEVHIQSYHAREFPQNAENGTRALEEDSTQKPQQ